jgi:hypothetical protein
VPVFPSFHAEGVRSNTIKGIYTRFYGLFTFSFLKRKMRCKRSAVTLAQAFVYRGADKSLARPTSRCTRILFDGENIGECYYLALWGKIPSLRN